MTIKDKHVWDTYTRDLTPVAKKKPRKTHAVQPMVDKTTDRQGAQKKVSVQPRGLSDGGLKGVALPLEHKREKKLRQGQLSIDATLDLHGMTQVEAFDALSHFMHTKVAQGKRHLLIVTGKGRGGEGVLRRNLEIWLRQLPEAPTILALRRASPKHGGEGAFYVILRKG